MPRPIGIVAVSSEGAVGCTEIPRLIDDDVSPLPALDSTRIRARAALREAARHDRTGEKGSPCR